MRRRVPYWLQGAAYGLIAALCLVLMSCGGKDPAGPNPGPVGGGGNGGGNGGGGGGDPQQHIVAGSYALGQINNQFTPGQNAALANPDGNLIGLYRFEESTSLVLDPLQTYTLVLNYGDEKGNYQLTDEGEFKWRMEGGAMILTFESATFGDTFLGKAENGMVAIQYDFDGDGAPDTVFAFLQVG